MKSYIIPVTWQCFGKQMVEANSLEEAIIKAENNPLPYNGEYIDDSYEIDHEGIPCYNDNLTKEELADFGI